MNTKRLHAAIAAAGIPIHGVAGDGIVHFKDEATAQQRTDAAAIVSGFDDSPAAEATWQRDKERALAAVAFTNGGMNGKVLRAVLLMVLDEFNLHALKINAILDAVDGAATLAALKTAVAAIADYPPRTSTQLRTALLGKLSSGAADT